MSQTMTTGRVKCGNRKAHGYDTVAYHVSAEAVRACYAGSAVPQSAPAPAVVQSEPFLRPDPERPGVTLNRQRVSVEEMQTWRSIPVGKGDTAYYALEQEDGSVDFYRVRRPSTGKYRGRTYVDQQAGDYFNPMPFLQMAVVASRIAAAPLAASTLYGQKIERCGMCHKSLTDDTNKGPDGLSSLERGIGPKCAKKMGLV